MFNIFRLNARLYEYERNREAFNEKMKGDRLERMEVNARNEIRERVADVERLTLKIEVLEAHIDYLKSRLDLYERETV